MSTGLLQIRDWSAGVGWTRSIQC